MTSFFCAEGGPIWIKFRRLVQNDMSTMVMWSKSGFILARVVRVKNESGRKFTHKNNGDGYNSPIRVLNGNTGVSVTHSTLLHMHSKLVVLGE